MKENNYITIPGFLRTRLDLKGSELIITALIYGYSQDGNSWFMGKTEYIAEWAGITDKNVLRSLKSLTEKGILEKKEIFVNNKAKRCYYRFNFECSELQNSTVAGYQNSTVNNNINNNINNNNIKKDAKASKENPDGFSQDNFSNEEKTVKASIVYGFTPELLDVRKQVIDKVDNYFAKLVFPFDSDEFKRNFYILMCQPKWRTSQKSFSAIQANLNGLSKYPEEFAMILIKESISKGWAALEYDSTPEKYEKWEKMKRSVKTEQQSSKEIADMMKYLNNDFD
nr:MAG: Replication initiator protein A (RepA) N-terminus [Bacteriophage sp.]